MAEHMAERVGFEPTDGRPSTVFKTAAFGHSATSPERSQLVIKALGLDLADGYVQIAPDNHGNEAQ